MATRSPAPASSSALPLVLRVGVVQDGRVVAERLFRPGEPVVVGDAADATFRGPGPRRVLLRPAGSGWVVPGGLDGAVSRQGVVAALSGPLLLDEHARGRVVLGDTTYLFQLVAAPPEPARVALLDLRPRLIEDEDPLFAGLLGAFTLVAAAFMAWVQVTPLPERVELEWFDDIAELPPVVRVALPDPLAVPEFVGAAPSERRAPRSAEPAPAGRPRSRLVHVFGQPGDGPSAFERLLGEDVLDLSAVRFTEGEASADPGTFRRATATSREDAAVTVDDLDAGDVEEHLGTGLTVTPRIEPERAPTLDEGDPADIASVVRKHQGRVTTCVEQSLKSNPGLSGRVSLGWTVVDGGVTEAHVVQNQTGDAALGACFERAVRGLRFGAGVNAEVAEFPWIVSGG